MKWRFEDLDAWCEATGWTREQLANQLVQEPSQREGREYEMWEFYRDRMIRDLTEARKGFPAPTMRKRIESEMERIANR